MTPRPLQLLRHRAQRGFSLIELMIGMVLGLVIGLAMLLVFNNISRTNNELAKVNTQVEGGRFALNLLTADIQLAGFWGSYTPDFDNLAFSGVPADAPTAIPDPCLAYSLSAWTTAHVRGLIGIGVQALDAPPGTCDTVLTDHKANTDVLVVRHADNCEAGVGSCEALESGGMYFAASRCSTQVATTPYLLAPTPHSPTVTQRNCTSASELRRYISNIYYIRTWANTSGDGIPTLVRSQFTKSGTTLSHNSVTPLVEGVEFMRIELGMDTLSDSGGAVNSSAAIAWANSTTKTSPTNRGDGVPDGTYVRCTTAAPCTANQLASVVSVRVNMLMRNTEVTPGYTDVKTYTLGGATLGPFNDRYQRHVYTTLVRMATVAGRRETP